MYPSIHRNATLLHAMPTPARPRGGEARPSKGASFLWALAKRVAVSFTTLMSFS
jgi:hypothetical protein